MSIESFINGYITAALWSSMDEADENGGEPMDTNYSEEDIAPETMEEIKADCQKFYLANLSLIEGEDLGRIPDGDVYSSAGHDFWLTRNGHGAGFWDGDWPNGGDKLTEASKAFKETNLYISDDGKIYAQ